MISKKAQTEIMGLVIIVVLVSLAMLFVVQFVVLKEPSTLKKTYTHKQLAANTLNTLVRTTTMCKGQEINQLLRDCAAYSSSGGIILCENGQGSCEFVRNAIYEILHNTLDAWNKEYAFYASIADIGFSNGNCTGERQTKINPIPTDAGVMTLRLDICG
jgi:hypothetical protein